VARLVALAVLVRGIDGAPLGSPAARGASVARWRVSAATRPIAVLLALPA
jgi:hypothetical protein